MRCLPDDERGRRSRRRRSRSARCRPPMQQASAATRPGQASITTPAIRLMTPKKISQPRPGSVGSLIAETVVATPRKMKPTRDPDGQQQNRVALAEVPECQHRQDERRRAADEQQDPAAGRHMQAEREEHLRDAGDQQVGAEEDRRRPAIVLPGQASISDAEDHREHTRQRASTSTGAATCFERQWWRSFPCGAVWHTQVGGKRNRSRLGMLFRLPRCGRSINVPLPAVRAGSMVVNVLGLSGG